MRPFSQWGIGSLFLVGKEVVLGGRCDAICYQWPEFIPSRWMKSRLGNQTTNTPKLSDI